TQCMGKAIRTRVAVLLGEREGLLERVRRLGEPSERAQNPTTDTEGKKVRPISREIEPSMRIPPAERERLVTACEGVGQAAEHEVHPALYRAGPDPQADVGALVLAHDPLLEQRCGIEGGAGEELVHAGGVYHEGERVDVSARLGELPR